MSKVVFQSGCDYRVTFGNGISNDFKFLDNQGGQIRIELPPNSGQYADFAVLCDAHGGWKSLAFLGCPSP